MRYVPTLVLAGILLPSLVGATRTFDLARDFQQTGNTEQSTWSYRFGAGNDRNGEYTLLPDNVTSGLFPSISWTPGPDHSGFWARMADEYSLPWVGANCTGVNQTSTGIDFAANRCIMHPKDTHFAVVSWKSPAAGTATVHFRFRHVQFGPGTNGTAWFVDKNASSLASGATGSGEGDTGPLQVSTTVAAGDRINFVVDDNVGFISDTTELTATICLDDGSPGFCEPAAGPVDPCHLCTLSASTAVCTANDVTIEFLNGHSAGTFTARNCSAPLDDIDAYCTSDALTFGLPTNPVQFWDVDYTGTFSGDVLLTFRYDDSHFLPFFSEESLIVFHLVDNTWQPLETTSRDLVNNTITVRTSSLSLFALGGPGTSQLVPVAAPWALAGLALAMVLVTVARMRRAAKPKEM